MIEKLILSKLSDFMARYNKKNITKVIKTDIELYIKFDSELNKPKPIPVFQVKSKLIKLFT